jgi:hypothetical protein
MERAWEVKIPIWNKNTSSQSNAEAYTFHVLAHTEDDAQLRALIAAAKRFPPPEGWSYDLDVITVRERSHQEVGEFLDNLSAENTVESQKRLDKEVDEFQKATGIKLKKPWPEND